jgi:uncharacterized protein YyaL (SSP411 family)
MKFNKLLVLAVLLFAFTAASAQQDANTVLNKALGQAKTENKNVFVMFHASWCSWCKLMDKNMQSQECKSIFDKNYVTVHFDVQERTAEAKKLETPGGDALLEKYEGKNSGLPFWVIVSPDGTVVANSFNSKGDNLGSPASPEEVAEFIEKLKKTGTFTDADIAAVRETFVLKK